MVFRGRRGFNAGGQNNCDQGQAEEARQKTSRGLRNHSHSLTDQRQDSNEPASAGVWPLLFRSDSVQ